jgi:hypothetical protein
MIVSLDSEFGSRVKRILSAVAMAYSRNPEDNGLRYPVEFLYSLVVVLFWVPALAVRRLRYFVRQIGSESWPRANGYITGGNVKVVHGWLLDYAVGQLDYSYKVHEEYYAGSLSRQYPDEQAAWTFVDAHRGQAVIVRYRDNNSGTCVLRYSDQDILWIGEIEPGFFAMLWQHWRDELIETDINERDSEIESEESGNKEENEINERIK